MLKVLDKTPFFANSLINQERIKEYAIANELTFHHFDEKYSFGKGNDASLESNRHLVWLGLGVNERQNKHRQE